MFPVATKRSRAVLAVALAAGLAAVSLPPPPAVAQAANPGEIDASIRTVFGVLDNYDSAFLFDDDATDVVSQTILRVTALGRPLSRLRYEVHGVQTFTYLSVPGGVDAGVALAGGSGEATGRGNRGTRYRALDLMWRWHDDSKTGAALLLDRANVKLRLPAADLTVGRQAITFGKTYFWNILDIFLPFDPEQFDRDYKPGVDAARLDVPIGTLSGFNLVAAAGRTVGQLEADSGSDGFWDSTWSGSAILGRAFTTWRGWDVAVQGGKVFGGYQIGGGLVGEVGLLELRLEAVRHIARGSPSLISVGVDPGGEFATQELVENSTSVVVGTGRRFDNSLTVELEYFHNGAGDSDDLEASALRTAGGGLLNSSEDLSGLSLSYELTPLVLGSIATIVSLNDGSWQLSPMIQWSAADEVEVLLGAILNFGDRPSESVAPSGAPLIDLDSEFGTSPHLFYGEVKYYF